MRRQRRTILKGLLCVLLSSLSAAATMLLIKYSIQAISDAENVKQQRVLPRDEVQRLSSALGKSQIEVSRALAYVEETRPNRSDLSTTDEFLVAQRLGIDSGILHSQLQQIYASRSGSEAVSGDSFLSRFSRLGKADPLAGLPPLGRLGFWCAVIVLMYVVRYWFVRGVTYYMSEAANRLASDLRVKLFDKLQRLPISYFNQKRAGAIQSVLTNDVNVFQTAVTIVRDSVEGPVKMVAAAVTIAFIQWRLFAIAILIFPVMFFVIQRNARKMKQASRQVQERLADVAAVTHEAIQGTRVIRAFSAETPMTERYGQLVEGSFKSQMRAVGYTAKLRPLVELIGAVGMAAVLFLCGWLASRGTLMVADIAAVIYGLDQINQGFRNLGSIQNTYAQVQAATDRIYGEILDVPEEHMDQRGQRTLPRPSGRIEFKDVSFTYPDGTEALSHVNFTIEPGSSLALVGPSGAGKSTIADLLLRFYDPTSGQILFDGEDIRELDSGWLRLQIGVVPQQTFLFAGTISENIRMGNPQATEEEVVSASRAAHADEFIAEIPERYETTVHERGVRLSGGQMQRVAIARALVRRPTVLLLDEATSALDAHSEQKVQQALDEIMRERTTLFIAHRLTTAARADRIVMLRRGEIVEQGSHRELMEANGPYAGMYRAFNSGLLDESLA